MQSMSIYVYIYVRHERRKRLALNGTVVFLFVFDPENRPLSYPALFLYLLFNLLTLFLYPLIILLNEAKEIVYKK